MANSRLKGTLIHIYAFYNYYYTFMLNYMSELNKKNILLLLGRARGDSNARPPAEPKPQKRSLFKTIRSKGLF